MAGGIPFGYFFFLTVDSITDRDNVQPRRWGMIVTITDDATPANNTQWILVKSLVNTDINDNSNWQTLAAYLTAIGIGPGGSSGDIQLNNGSGAFVGGLGNMTSARTSLPVTSGTGASGLRLTNANEFNYEYHTLLSASYNGGALSANILDVANVKVSSTFILEAIVSGVQTSGTAGSTGFTFKLIAAFRVTSAGVLAILAASVQDANYTFNDTGDSFSGTPSLTVNVGNTNVNLNLNLTTAKTLRVATWVKIRAVAN